MGSPPSVNFYLTPKARQEIERLAGEYDCAMGDIVMAALTYYRTLLAEGKATKPETTSLALGKQSPRVTIPDKYGIRDWLADLVKETGATRGAIFLAALATYMSALKNGEVPEPGTKRPARPEPEKPSKAKPPQPLPSPRAKGVPVDRGPCPVCEKQAPVDSATGLLASHVAHPSVRPRGKFVLCAGSGQTPAGPIVHAADTNQRLV